MAHTCLLMPYMLTVVSSANPGQLGFFTVACGRCRGFRVPFTGIVSGLVSLWQGFVCCCCWWCCICFDTTVQKILVCFEGTCACVGCLLSSSAQTMMGFYICSMCFKSVLRKTPVSSNINEKVLHLVWLHQSLQHQYLLKIGIRLFSFLIAVKLNPCCVIKLHLCVTSRKAPASADLLFITTAWFHSCHVEPNTSAPRTNHAGFMFAIKPVVLSLLFHILPIFSLSAVLYKHIGCLFAPTVYSL